MLDFFLTVGLYSSVLFFCAVVFTNLFDQPNHPDQSDQSDQLKHCSDEQHSKGDAKEQHSKGDAKEQTAQELEKWLFNLDAPMDIEDNPKIAFVTLTNNAYHHFTLNCLKSLRFLQGPQLQTYCIGNECAKNIQLEGYPVSILHADVSLQNRQLFRKGLWGSLTQKKFAIIHKNLLVHDYVCITDGDIVFRKSVWEYLLNSVTDLDILIQNDTMDDSCTENLCSGFMFIKKTPATLEVFDPINTINRVSEIEFDDQVYINEVKHKLNFGLLPLDLFPNGKYFYHNQYRIDPMLIHFNWCMDKIKAMQSFGYWNE